MKYGISLLPDCSPDKRSATSYFDDVLSLSELAEELGMHYVKMTEHYLHPAGGYCPSPLAFLAAVAQRTQRIRLMTGGIQASFHHPIQIAAQAAQIDVMSHGRLDVGFARAFLPYEFEAFGVDMDNSRARFQTTVDTVVRLWTEKSVTADTSFFRFQDATSLPDPIQQPHPPVWICAVMSESSFRWAGEKGFNLLITSPPKPETMELVGGLVSLYRKTFVEHHGRSGRRPEVALSVPLVAADTDEEALRIAEPAMQHNQEVWRDAARSLLTLNSPDYAGYAETIGKAFEGSVKDYSELGVIGSPDTVARKIELLRDALYLDTILWLVDLGGQDYKAMERTLRLFSDEALPRVSG